MTWAIEVVTDYTPCEELRRIVFQGEQGVSDEDEWDGLDDQAVHLLATIEGRPVGSARLLTKGGTGKISRVCVLKDVRGSGLGAALIKASVAHFEAQSNVARCMLGAQCHAIGFYEALGFIAYGPVYDDAGIDHRDMERTL
ncbi:putative N-acetyltransferase YjcF [Shimia sp. SK013]|uniref:GNAT family N-acetyltransferase n=1 Tax=Shimia sp. SK013 TaxID=1389006 RepID=UPI0006B62069|nr:GNAT family N-acetyltransferase [Shimia sp. SK013]KPA20274.1 putative N-acetyltransferase YjcF [Shimia sp. SK013]